MTKIEGCGVKQFGYQTEENLTQYFGNQIAIIMLKCNLRINNNVEDVVFL